MIKKLVHTDFTDTEYLHRLILSKYRKTLSGQVSKAEAKETVKRACGLSKEQLIESLCRNYNGQVVTACEDLDLI